LERSTMRQKIQLLSATFAFLAISSIAARPADDITPPSGYRNWFHVNTMIIDKASPLFEALGGMHNVHVNSVGEDALKKGGPYPDGTIFLTDLHDFSVSDGSTTMGKLKGVAVMVKDAKRYAATGGWGFQFFADGDASKKVVTDAATQCFACHTPQKAQDYVYSTYIP
jgi:cytochrome P460